MDTRQIVQQRAEAARGRLLGAKPRFTTTWSDMFYSVIVYGALPFIFASLATGLLGGMIGLAFLQPSRGFTFGFMSMFLLSGLVVSAIASLPLALISHFTRHPDENKKIDNTVQRFKRIKADKTKKTIISRIVNDSSMQRTGIRSFSSASLLIALNRGYPDEVKWKRINDYITNRTGANYTHNGKKLFKTICQAVDSHTKNVDVQPTYIHKLELATIILMIAKPTANNQGLRLFSKSNVTPTGILRLRQCLSDNGLALTDLTEEQMIETLTATPADVLQDIFIQLKEIVYHRGDSIIFRSDYIQTIYDLIDNAGNDPEKTFKTMGVSTGILNDILDPNADEKRTLNLIKLHLQYNVPAPADNRLSERVASYLRGGNL